MSFRKLLADWEACERPRTTETEYTVRLPLEDAARLHALAELYPGVGIERIITDLLATSLEEVVEAMPYVQGDAVIREDELGDPVFEDAGATPRFLELTRKHRARLSGGSR